MRAECLVEMEKLEKTNKDSRKAQVPHELATKAIQFIQTRNSALAKKAQLARVEKWLSSHTHDVDHLTPYATQYREQLAMECKAIDDGNGLLLTNHGGPGEWFDLFDIFTR